MAQFQQMMGGGGQGGNMKEQLQNQLLMMQIAKMAAENQQRMEPQLGNPYAGLVQ